MKTTVSAITLFLLFGLQSEAALLRDGHVYTVKNRGNEFCLQGNTGLRDYINNGETVITAHCHGGDSQKWMAIQGWQGWKLVNLATVGSYATQELDAGLNGNVYTGQLTNQHDGETTSRVWYLRGQQIGNKVLDKCLETDSTNKVSVMTCAMADFDEWQQWQFME